MIWINFPLYVAITFLFWVMGLILLYANKKAFLSIASLSVGTLVLVFFVTNLWLLLDRPPMRTLGETRLWYSLFLPIIGLLTYYRWKYKWFMVYSFALASLFLLINLLSPESYNKTLMPALRSVWFVPHVIVYIISYALLAASSLVSVKALYQIYTTKKDSKLMPLADNLVYIGFAFLTLGLLFGALWAKEAWGHYWTWDPKETWAFLTWLVYLIYIHLRHQKTVHQKSALWVLALAFAFLLICWFGVNYLPSAANSVHTYTQ